MGRKPLAFYVYMATTTKARPAGKAGKKSPAGGRVNKKRAEAEELENQEAEIRDTSVMGMLVAGIAEPPKDGDIVEFRFNV